MKSLDVFQVMILVITSLLGAGAIACVGKGLKLHFRGRADIRRKDLDNRIKELNQQKQDLSNKIEELEKKRSQLPQGSETDDLDWRIDDNNWLLKDINWEIADAKWEFDDRTHQERTSMATFWTVLGAALFALASLVIGVFRLL